MGSKARKFAKFSGVVAVVAVASFVIGRYGFEEPQAPVATLAVADQVDVAAPLVQPNEVGRTVEVDGIAVAVVSIRLEGRTVIAEVSAMNQTREARSTGTWGWVTPAGLAPGVDAAELPAGAAINGVVTTDAVVGDNQLVYTADGGAQVVVAYSVTSEMIEVVR